jgi:hypothetical protein
LVNAAQEDLNPLISSQLIENQAAIIANYVRTGPQAFWEGVGEKRKMTPAQIEEWRDNPDRFRLLNGNKPNPLDSGNLNERQMNQIREAEIKTRPSYNFP